MVYDGVETTWGEKYVEKYLEGKQWRSDIANKRLKLISAFYHTSIRNLDVGGATGLFSECLRASGHISVNYEPDSEFRSESKASGIRTYSSYHDIPNASFNLVTIFDSLGYSMDLSQDLNLLSKKLERDGIVFATFGFTDYGLKNCPDTSFNYYFHTKTIPFLFNALGCKAHMYWVEDRSFNQFEGTDDDRYWKHKLLLSDDPKMLYCVGLRGQYNENVPARSKFFWSNT